MDVINYNEIKNDKRINVIYCWTNLINGKVYIGQTTDKRGIMKRYADHKNYSENINSPNYNKPLPSAIRKYGINNFKLEVIDVADTVEELNEKEMYYIEKYNSLVSGNGYNIREGGNNTTLSDDIKNKMSEAHKKENIGEEKYNKQLECLAKGEKFKSGKDNPSYGTGMIYIAVDVKTEQTYEFYSRLDAVEFVNGNKGELYKASRGKQHKSKKYPNGNYYKGYLWYIKER